MSVRNYLVRFAFRGQRITGIVARETADAETLWLILDQQTRTYYRRPPDCEVAGYQSGVQRLSGEDLTTVVELKRLMKSPAGRQALSEAWQARKPDRAAPVRIRRVEPLLMPGSHRGDLPSPGGPPPTYLTPMDLSDGDGRLTPEMTAHVARNDAYEDDGLPRKRKSREMILDILEERSPRHYRRVIADICEPLTAREVMRREGLRTEAAARKLRQRAREQYEQIADEVDALDPMSGGARRNEAAA